VFTLNKDDKTADKLNMNLKENQYRQIEKLLPVQRGNVRIDNRRLLAALVYRCEKGCSWRALPEPFGPWHVVYVRLNRRAKSGVLERVYAALVAQGLTIFNTYALDSTAVKVHPSAHGARKKRQTGYRKD
jgi:transposase